MENKKSLKNKLTLVVLGRSGSGKGTQARFLLRRLRRYGVRHLETGRFLRTLLQKNRNPTTEIAAKIIWGGGFVPAWFAAYTWLRELIERGSAAKHLVFDGSPRKLWETKFLDEVMQWHGRSLPLCILVEVTPREATRRLLLRGRRDDTKSGIRNRLREFTREVLPSIRHFETHGRLIRVNGNPPPEVVWRELDGALAKRLGRRWPKRE